MRNIKKTILFSIAFTALLFLISSSSMAQLSYQNQDFELFLNQAYQGIIQSPSWTNIFFSLPGSWTSQLAIMQRDLNLRSSSMSIPFINDYMVPGNNFWTNQSFNILTPWTTPPAIGNENWVNQLIPQSFLLKPLTGFRFGDYGNQNLKAYREYLGMNPFYSSFAMLSYMNPFYYPYTKPASQKPVEPPAGETTETMGLMLLIEFEGVEGLNNFVYELQEREIPSLLIVSADFVAENCENIKKLQEYGVEIGGVCSQEPFWNKPYQEQFEAIKTTKEIIEACTGKPMRIIGSRYFAYDENTLQAAENLGVPYVLARGTTGARATIYKPEEYNVRIFSVSNVASPKWGTGSLCDYSYWAREGSPEDFGVELFDALKYDKISPVSHTYLGGLKAAWNAQYIDFFDNTDVIWTDLDSFGEIDITQPFSEIPQNREVQYTTPKPLIPLDEEANIDNPCSIDDFPFTGTMGLMLLSESESVVGLNNFVYELQSRGIPALLGVTADFAVENCINLIKLQKYGVEIRASYSAEPFWDKPYEEQYELMRDTVETIETCIGKPVRAFSSRYFAYDENTVKAAEALRIEYILARGTTGAKATIYKPEEYDVKIFSVSNVGSEKWGTGSLCDISYWSREGSTEQFKEELFDSLEYNKISPVSHTHIGGAKAAWNEVYLDFFDNADVKWMDLDGFGIVDITLPFSEIPQNREVQYTTPIPLIPLDEESDVEDMHSIDDFPLMADVGNMIVFFHNGSGPMCLDFLDFLDTISYPVEEHLISDQGFWNDMAALESLFGSSEGLSQSFGYFPIIFIKDKAYSGFNNEIKEAILGMI
ncbi:MAG: polysaccharide deacetylase family protein [bacterium]